MSGSYTPGPWVVVEAAAGKGIDGKELFDVESESTTVASDVWHADARAIACVPELLIAFAEAIGALKACADALSSTGHPKTAKALDAKANEFLALLVKATKS